MARRKPFRKNPPSAPAHVAGANLGGTFWIYGHHVVTGAVGNPRRRIRRLLAALPTLSELPSPPSNLEIERVEASALSALLPAGAVHQGMAALVDPLPMVDLGDLLDGLSADAPAHLVVLDQVTDPQNVGAILRSASAFGATGLVLTERHAAPESGVLAKAASGALDHLPIVRVVNLVRAMEELKQAQFWCLGLAADGEKTLAEANLTGRIALILGAEGTGLRRLTREHCDQLLRLPTVGPIAQLNVSNAAAVALYELVRIRDGR